MSTPAPLPAEQLGGLSLAWVRMVGATIRRDGQAVRAGSDAATIEVQSINTGRWLPLTLERRPGGDCTFATIADRDAVLREIQRNTQEQPIRSPRP